MLSKLILLLFIGYMLETPLYAKKYRKSRARRLRKKQIHLKSTIKPEKQIEQVKEKILKAKKVLREINYSKEFNAPLVPVIKININNKLNNFTVLSFNLQIDGKDILSIYNQQKLEGKIIELLEGKHIVYTRLVVKGKGSGIFNYLATYTVVKEANKNINIPSRAYYELKISIFEKSALFNTFTERPNISIELEKTRDIRVK